MWHRKKKLYPLGSSDIVSHSSINCMVCDQCQKCYGSTFMIYLFVLFIYLSHTGKDIRAHHEKESITEGPTSSSKQISRHDSKDEDKQGVGKGELMWKRTDSSSTAEDDKSLPQLPGEYPPLASSSACSLRPQSSVSSGSVKEHYQLLAGPIVGLVQRSRPMSSTEIVGDLRSRQDLEEEGRHSNLVAICTLDGR